MKFTSRYISATCLEYNFGSDIDKKISDMVLKVYTFLPQLLDLKQAGIIDIIPSYTSLALHFTTSCELLHNRYAFDNLIKEAAVKRDLQNPTEHTIYVDYNGEDLDDVCRYLDLSKKDFIDLHASAYSIAMIGFREYFPYLLGLDKKLYIPRRDAPRNKVLKGSVAIAAGQTGIYPEDSPGGWHIIGHTDFDAFTTLKPADIISFKSKEQKCS